MPAQQNKPLVLGDEIFNLIMSGLDHKSLTVVCRTTKLFHKYSVGILWRSLDGILPLMKLFSEDVVTYEKARKSFTFRKILQVKDWIRFEYYAPFVRTFCFDEKDTSWTSFSDRWTGSLALRSFLALHKELLPALTTLEWKATTSSSLLIGLPHFVTQKLDALSVTFLTDDTTAALPGLAGFLEPNPPPLTNLEIILCFEAGSDSRSFFDTAHDVRSIVRIFPRVSRLRIDTWILAYGVKSPLVLQNLREILLSRYVDWKDTPEYDSGSLISSTNISLPHLEFVASHCLNWDSLRSLLQSSGDTLLGFTYSQPGTMNQWHHDHSLLVETFKEMGKRFVNLVTLTLQDIRILEKDADLTGSLLPFLQCTNLQELDILAEAGFVRFISDNDISQMAGAWPLLKKFIIRYSDFEESTGKDTEASDLIPFSFSSITTLVQHCPLLRTLSLSIKMVNDPMLDNQIRHEAPFQLEELDLGYSLVTDENAFVLLIRDLCPVHRVKWDDEGKLTALKVTMGGLQVVAQTRRAEESTRQAMELRQRVEMLVEEVGELRERYDVQMQTLNRHIEGLRTENEALRSGAELVQRSEDVKPFLKAE